MAINSPETLARIAEWRAKALNNTLTVEDMREALRTMRGDRAGAAFASDASRRKKAKAEIPDAQSLLDELGEL